MKPARRSALECCEETLHALDRVLDERPASIQPICLALTESVVRLRDTLIEAHRANGNTGRELLTHTNSILSLAFSTQYPMLGVQWEKLKKAREALAGHLAQFAGDGPRERQR